MLLLLLLLDPVTALMCWHGRDGYPAFPAFLWTLCLFVFLPPPLCTFLSITAELYYSKYFICLFICLSLTLGFWLQRLSAPFKSWYCLSPLQCSNDSHSKAELPCKSQMTNRYTEAMLFLSTSSSSSFSSPQLPVTCFFLSAPPTPNSEWQWQTEMHNSTNYNSFPLLRSTVKAFPPANIKQPQLAPFTVKELWV